MLHRQHGRTTPLHPRGEPLQDAAGHQQHHRGPADPLETGQQADRRGRQPHGQQGGDEQRLASDPVPQVTRDDPAQRTEEERDRERRERGDHRPHARALREEVVVEHQRGRRPVEVEVVPLDGRAHERRRQHPLLRAHRRTRGPQGGGRGSRRGAERDTGIGAGRRAGGDAGELRPGSGGARGVVVPATRWNGARGAGEKSLVGAAGCGVAHEQSFRPGRHEAQGNRTPSLPAPVWSRAESSPGAPHDSVRGLPSGQPGLLGRNS